MCIRDRYRVCHLSLAAGFDFSTADRRGTQDVYKRQVYRAANFRLRFIVVGRISISLAHGNMSRRCGNYLEKANMGRPAYL